LQLAVDQYGMAAVAVVSPAVVADAELVADEHMLKSSAEFGTGQSTTSPFHLQNKLCSH
jgi:hypothetical protein